MNAAERSRHLAHRRLEEYVSGGHRPERTLVIIDMQTDFYDKDEIIPNICSLIQYARQKIWAIIVVEYEGRGNTDDAIIQALDEYPHKETVYKQGMDGGKKVLDCINSHPSWPLDLLVCGIYGHACVPETVSGLFKSSDLVEISVVTDAVFKYYYPQTKMDEHDRHPEWMITMKNVLIDEESEVASHTE
ncbi:hypothetical protein LCGC14_0220670 [marine sediment metagenome]|uniref:Isochorismatase-like domain-containing protein n=1 Tax=marine sediment metagenome TaxID=412755 RepID=A0A0F9UHQ5_9ZZZZ